MATGDFATGGFLTGLAVAGAVVAGVFAVTWVVAQRIGRWAVVDVTWGLAFVAVALAAFIWGQGRHTDTARQVLVLDMVGIWGIRLAVHIGARSRGQGEDPRYEAMFRKAKGSHAVYALETVFGPQAVIAFLVSMPVQVTMYERRPIGPIAWCGAAVWAVGIFFEAVGDHQMQRFRGDPANKGQVMDHGLWRYTRHPNYFGDSCVWAGIWLVASQQWQGLLAFGSPLLMFYFLYFQSGKALLEKMMIKTKPGYAEYVQRTSGFLPLPPRAGRPSLRPPTS